MRHEVVRREDKAAWTLTTSYLDPQENSDPGLGFRPM